MEFLAERPRRRSHLLPAFGLFVVLLLWLVPRRGDDAGRGTDSVARRRPG